MARWLVLMITGGSGTGMMQFLFPLQMEIDNRKHQQLSANIFIYETCNSKGK